MKPLFRNLAFLAAGALLVLLFRLGSCKGTTEPPVTIPAEKIQKQVNDSVKQLTARIALIEAENEELQETDTKLRTELSAARIKRNATAAAARSRPGITHQETEDLNDYARDVATTDSICDLTIANQDSIIKNRNQVITAKDSVISVFRYGFDTATTALRKEQKYNLQLEKDLKRARRGGAKVLKYVITAAGVYILADKIK